MSPPRRDLRFAALGEIVPDAENLLARGYDRAGTWDLSQVCNHLAAWTTYPFAGYPPVPLVMRPVVWAFRNTLGMRVARKMILGRDGRMKTGLSTVPASVFTPADDAAAVAALRAATARAEAFTGELVLSPVLGPMTKAAWAELHLLHAAHHLSFLTPK